MISGVLASAVIALALGAAWLPEEVLLALTPATAMVLVAAEDAPDAAELAALAALAGSAAAIAADAAVEGVSAANDLSPSFPPPPPQAVINAHEINERAIDVG